VAAAIDRARRMALAAQIGMPPTYALTPGNVATHTLSGLATALDAQFGADPAQPGT
jgi:hypothetical protein